MDDNRPARPRVTVHYAQTLDGRIATSTGHSQWISCPESLRLAHELRASHRAVLVGVGTVIADNPRLTVRLVPGRSPIRVIVDSRLRIPMDANVLVDGEAETIVVTTDSAPAYRVAGVEGSGGRVLYAAQDDEGRVDLLDALGQLRDVGVDSVLVEGGRALITSILRRQLVDRLIVCVAPKLVGRGIDAVGDLEIRRLSDALVLADTRVTRLGDDVIIDGRLASARTRCH